MDDIQISLFGKMSPEPSAPTKERTSAESSKRSAKSKSRPFLFLDLRGGRKPGGVLGDGYSVAWRVLDAQYWGVPQRRERIFLVADFTGDRASKILFESEGVSGDTPQSGEQGQGIADTPEDRTGTAVSYQDRCGCAGGVKEYSNRSTEQERYQRSTISSFSAETICIEGNGSRKSHFGDGYRESDKMYTLNTVEQHAVAFGLDRASFNQGKNAQYDFSVEEELAQTLVAKGPGGVSHRLSTQGGDKLMFENHSNDSRYTGPLKTSQTVSARFGTGGNNQPLIKHDYIVRRLTPTECARLQGFPDWWCDGLEIEEPTDEDMEFWRKVFDTYAEINGTKPRTDNAIRKWLRSPHSDSAEYKMWGNGVALPCVEFVLKGIKWASTLPVTTEEEAEEEQMRLF